MSKAWAEKNNATKPADLTTKEENFATRNAMGTGPFRLVSREPDRKTVLERNPGWWDKPTHNIERAELNIIANDATRVAALLSGEVDFVYTVPPQDVDADRQQRRRADHPGAGAADDLSRHGPAAAGAAEVRRQGQEPLPGRAGAPGGLPGDRRQRDPAHRHARPVAADRPDVGPRRERLRRPRTTPACRSTRRRRRSCWPRPGTRTASASPWTARTTAT